MDGKPFASPMLVTQGNEHGNACKPSVTASVKRTCEMNPGSQIEYIRMENITHVPALYAGQHTFMDWVHDRFAGKEVAEDCSQMTWSPSRGYASAEFDGFKDQTGFLEYDVYGISEYTTEKVAKTRRYACLYPQVTATHPLWLVSYADGSHDSG